MTLPSPRGFTKTTQKDSLPVRHTRNINAIEIKNCLLEPELEIGLSGFHLTPFLAIHNR
jgi:hypothetical protein